MKDLDHVTKKWPTVYNSIESVFCLCIVNGNTLNTYQMKTEQWLCIPPNDNW